MSIRAVKKCQKLIFSLPSSGRLFHNVCLCTCLPCVYSYLSLPGIFPLLTGISIFCLANNSSAVFRNVFGGASNNEGMGLLSWCFDWNLIGSTCLYAPIWLQINQDIGIIFTYILMSAVYYGNLWEAKKFPFMSQAIFVRVSI